MPKSRQKTVGKAANPRSNSGQSNCMESKVLSREVKYDEQGRKWIVVKIRCIGISPLIMDKFTAPEYSCAIYKPGMAPSPRTDGQLLEEKIYRDEKSRIGLPATMIMAALYEATRRMTGKYVKTLDFMRIDRDFLPLTDGKGGKPRYKSDVRRAISAGIPVFRVVRPRFEKWGFNLTLAYDNVRISGEKLRELFDLAGSGQGLGALRPNKRGPFGRFKVVCWTETKKQTRLSCV